MAVAGPVTPNQATRHDVSGVGETTTVIADMARHFESSESTSNTNTRPNIMAAASLPIRSSTAEDSLKLYISGPWFSNEEERKATHDKLVEATGCAKATFYDYTSPEHTAMPIEKQMETIIEYSKTSDGFVIDRTNCKDPEALNKSGAYMASVVAYECRDRVPVIVVDPIKHDNAGDRKGRTIHTQYRCGFSTSFFHHVSTMEQAIEIVMRYKSKRVES